MGRARLAAPQSASRALLRCVCHAPLPHSARVVCAPPPPPHTHHPLLALQVLDFVQCFILIVRPTLGWNIDEQSM